MQHGRLASVSRLWSLGQLVGPAGPRDDGDRHVLGPAGVAQAAGQRGELPAGHVEDLAVGIGGPAFRPVSCVIAVVRATLLPAPRRVQRSLRRGGSGQGRGDAGDDLAFDACAASASSSSSSRPKTLGSPPFQPDDELARARVLDEQGFDRRLAGGSAARRVPDAARRRSRACRRRSIAPGGASERRAGSASESKRTTSAALSRLRRRRTVMRSARPGRRDEDTRPAASRRRPSWRGARGSAASARSGRPG